MSQGVLSSPESDTALSDSELMPYYHLCCRHWQPEASLVEAEGTRHQGEWRKGGKGEVEETPDGALDHRAQQQQRSETASPVMPAEVVLAAAAQGLVRLFSPEVAGGGGGGGNSDDRASDRLLLVSTKTWTACVAEASRRSARVARLLGRDRTTTSGRKGAVVEGGAAVETAAASRSEGTGVAASGGEGGGAEGGAEEEEGDGEM